MKNRLSVSVVRIGLSVNLHVDKINLSNCAFRTLAISNNLDIVYNAMSLPQGALQ